MAIKECRECHTSKTIQPFNSSTHFYWTCPKCRTECVPLQPLIISDQIMVLLTANEYKRVCHAA